MKKLPTLMITLLAVALGASPALAADEGDKNAEQAPAATTSPTDDFTARTAHQRALAAQQKAAHQARVEAMRAASERFRDQALSQGATMDPWGRSLMANAELQRRLMDPYGSAMLDRLQEDFWNRTAAYGGRPEVADPHQEISQWARQQQQAIHERSRQAQQQFAKALQEGKVTYAPVVPWGGWYAPYGWGAPYYGYGAPYFW